MQLYSDSLPRARVHEMITDLNIWAFRAFSASGASRCIYIYIYRANIYKRKYIPSSMVNLQLQVALSNYNPHFDNFFFFHLSFILHINTVVIVIVYPPFSWFIYEPACNCNDSLYFSFAIFISRVSLQPYPRPFAWTIKPAFCGHSLDLCIFTLLTRSPIQTTLFPFIIYQFTPAAFDRHK